jgi:hypothetical protein
MVENTGVMATGGKTTVLGKTLSQCQCNQHKLHPDGTGNESGSTQWNAGDYNHLTHCTASDVWKIGYSELTVNLKKVQKV